ncbi:hypothetical protein V9T40_014127 [Parthenolecanium corni]|uniref:Uncharacterized protein n=1 Tax=Parthenolecanium corni TaxID=536013 RepID=A0AAN9TG32_9HEMI
MLNSTRLEPGNATGVETNVLARTIHLIFRSSHCMAHTRKGLCFINSGVANDRIEMEQSRAEQSRLPTVDKPPCKASDMLTDWP